MTYQAAAKLAPAKARGGRVSIGGSEADPIAVEWRNPQTTIDDYVEQSRQPRVVGGVKE